LTCLFVGEGRVKTERAGVQCRKKNVQTRIRMVHNIDIDPTILQKASRNSYFSSISYNLQLLELIFCLTPMMKTHFLSGGSSFSSYDSEIRQSPEAHPEKDFAS
jgi:hypothetical protein